MKIYAATPITGFGSDSRRLMSLRAWDFINEVEPHEDREVYMPIDHYDPYEDMPTVFARNMWHLERSDAVYAFNPSISKGAHMEVGYALGKGLPLFLVNFKCFPIDTQAAMLLGVPPINGEYGPARFDHRDECVLRGSSASPCERCGCLEIGTGLV